jgi:uncharacterized protein (TIGR03000 family)
MLKSIRLALATALLTAPLFATSQVHAQARGGGRGYSGYGGYSPGGYYGGGYPGGGFPGAFGSAGANYGGYGAYAPRNGENGFPTYGALPGYNTGNGGYPGLNPTYGGFPPYNPGYGGFSGNYPSAGGMGGANYGNMQGGYPYPVVVPLPYGSGNYGNGYSNGQNAPSQAAAPQRRIPPSAGNYLYGTDGSVSFYSTPPPDPVPPDNASVEPPPAYTPSDLRSSPAYTPVPPAPSETLPIARVLVHVPSEAHLWFEGVETHQGGTERTFKSTPLEPGRPYLYDIKARWWEDGKAVERTRTITVRSGEVVRVDLTTGE